MTETATEAPTETPDSYVPDTECRNCGGPVKRRRPSMTGAHFCQLPACRAAKQRFYYRSRQSNEAELAKRSEEAGKASMAALVRAAITEDRVDCDRCGRTGVVSGFPHPTPEWNAACHGTGARELPRGTQWLVEAIYPR